MLPDDLLIKFSFPILKIKLDYWFTIIFPNYLFYNSLQPLFYQIQFY